MSKIMDELLKLYSLDMKLMDLKRRYQAGPEEIKLKEEQLTEFKRQKSIVSDAVKEGVTLIDKCNLEIKTMEAEIEDAESKLHVIKNNKEYKILTDQVKSLKQSISNKENEELKAMEELETLKNNMLKANEDMDAVELELANLREEVQKESETIKSEAAEFKNSRKAMIDHLKATEPVIMDIYADAFHRGKGQAMAEVLKNACQMCFRKLSPNLEAAIMSGTDIQNCRCMGCGRILYLKEPVNS